MVVFTAYAPLIVQGDRRMFRLAILSGFLAPVVWFSMIYDYGTKPEPKTLFDVPARKLDPTRRVEHGSVWVQFVSATVPQRTVPKAMPSLKKLMDQVRADIKKQRETIKKAREDREAKLIELKWLDAVDRELAGLSDKIRRHKLTYEQAVERATELLRDVKASIRDSEPANAPSGPPIPKEAPAEANAVTFEEPIPADLKAKFNKVYKENTRQLLESSARVEYVQMLHDLLNSDKITDEQFAEGMKAAPGKQTTDEEIKLLEARDAAMERIVTAKNKGQISQAEAMRRMIKLMETK